MIAHDSRGTPENARALSAAITEQLRTAIDARWRARTASEVEQRTATLREALERAAAEARDRSLHPEELILAIKALEVDVAGTVGAPRDAERQALRTWLVTACIRAYFSAP